MKINLDRVKIGMIGLVGTDGSLVGKVIEREQLDEGFGKVASQFTHVFISGGGMDEVSATFPKSKRRTLDAYRGRAILFLYPKDLEFRKYLRYKFAFFCASEANKAYPVQALTWWLLPDWLKGSSNWLTRGYLKFCSALASWGMWKIGQDLWPDTEDAGIMPAAFYEHRGLEHVYLLDKDWSL